MKLFLLGVLIAVLCLLVFKNYRVIICTIFSESEICQPARTMIVVPEPPQKIFKWTDEEGVVHYGEEELGHAERIDDQLDGLTIISGGKQAKTRNRKATGNLMSARSTSSSRTTPYQRSTSTNTNWKMSKKKRCSYLAGKRDEHAMSSSKHKRFRSQYSHECIF